ncbi:5-methyltetrahydropteroyltriglutamate--homocysteine methyltransferase [Streptomyces noursei]|uniref:5-methyltetrahydropteroyltriglutamate-- homocysteine methyltransferase n=1 Tax=Streptomyces noursei TaxID=1971 RepID=UPI00167899BB|nr:5-methyltetrahydropteroyltriglutamate--homocysteine methyltransferase [Streptomyces noursei]MCZ1014426.1 5-methyltetrahydropteroyltriglutamate--homocysteine methyltransferase [Streptomyces noursei]GGW94937.1 5-methyltetrahydropteroyltriglutamate--homocysteine methyltransferase [Streptomyces noursei]
MSIPTEPIGSIPRPRALQEALVEHAEGRLPHVELAHIQEQATADTLARLEQLGCPVLVDGDQAKPSSITYPLAGLTNLDPNGVIIPYADGHIRQLPRLMAGPFRYQVRADTYLRAARKLTDRPVKQAVVAPSALSLLYPGDPIDGYSREAFLEDLANEAEAEIRGCLDAGAHCVQLDFTEGRLSLKLDPTGGVLDDFIALNNEVLGRFDENERARLGVHTSPGADHDSTHSLDIDYAELLPRLLQLKAGNLYLQHASEPDPERVLKIVADQLRPDIRVFVGVTDPISTTVETPEEVRDRILLAARYIPVDQLGTCDDAGFSPFADDTSTSLDLAFAKIEARVRGTALAAEALGL